MRLRLRLRLPMPVRLAMQVRPCPPRRVPVPLRLRLAALLTAAFAAGATAAHAQDAVRLEVEGPRAARDVIERSIEGWEPGTVPRDRFAAQRAEGELRRRVLEALATEGWFTPTVDVADDGERLRVTVEPGTRTTVADVDLEFRGAIADDAGRERREQLRRRWALGAGEPFRQDDWTVAKRRLLNELLAEDFAAARLEDSAAEVDAEASRARLRVVVDSGPRFTLGELRIEGLSEYDRRLVERYVRFSPGDRFTADTLLKLQTALQNTPYFSSVSVEIERDPAAAERVPVVVRLTEAPSRRVSLGAGYSTNTGVRGEAVYRDANFFDRAWQLATGVRIEQLRQLGFATLQLPPRPDDARDALTALAERSDIQNLTVRRALLGVSRTRLRGIIETRLSFDFQREERTPQGEETTYATALTANWSWTRRDIDNPLDPREGTLINAQVGGGTKTLLSDQNFLRLLLRAERFWPVGRDTFSIHTLLGSTIAPSRQGIPQSFLFRTGGAQTVRGYAFESLGVREGQAVVGGRFLAVVGAEYVHWLREQYGVAAFVDAGNAVDRVSDYRFALGYGVGARYRSPLGPLALDIAWGQDDRRLRAHLSIAVAF